MLAPLLPRMTPGYVQPTHLALLCGALHHLLHQPRRLWELATPPTPRKAAPRADTAGSHSSPVLCRHLDWFLHSFATVCHPSPHAHLCCSPAPLLDGEFSDPGGVGVIYSAHCTFMSSMSQTASLSVVWSACPHHREGEWERRLYWDIWHTEAGGTIWREQRAM